MSEDVVPDDVLPEVSVVAQRQVIPQPFESLPSDDHDPRLAPSSVMQRATLECVRPSVPPVLVEAPAPIEAVVPEVAAPEAVANEYVEAQRSENEAPAYPAKELRLGREGTVVLRVSVAADGSVVEVSLCEPSRYPGFNREALRAARRWQFTPATQAGLAVASETEVEVVFQLSSR